MAKITPIPSHPARESAPTAAEPAAWLNLVAEKVANLDYGVVQIVVHDGRVVQVERTERHRFDLRSAS